MKTTKHFLTLVLLGSLLFTFSSCEEENTVFFYDMVINFTVDPEAQPNGNRVLSTTVVTTGIEAQLNDVGGSIDNVESIQLDTAYAVINTPAGTTFDIVEWVELSITAGTLPSQKIAFKSPVPQTGLDLLTFDNQFAELADYIKNDEFTLEVRGGHDDPILQPVNATVTTTWKVSVKP